MKKQIQIGERIFSSQKEALAYYKMMLNSYEFGQSLNDSDFGDLLALLNYDYQMSLNEELQVESIEANVVEDEENKESVFVENIKVSKVQFKTKCFEIFLSDKTSYYTSYIMLVNRKDYNPESIFATACRNCIQSDLVTVKQQYFKDNFVNGGVKCQETGVLSTWEELAVDHRQPNTLSVIIDRFKEINDIDLEVIEYRTTKSNLIIFKDAELMQKFVLYHRGKATLRVVRKERNSARSAMGRVKRNSKDLPIGPSQLSLF
ncbi:DUF3223 domain-containing protein [Hymenobacter sp. ISL-91]|uniref:DUF3223 domain-containing protein n=1 Tax=Hymenobacter sp. ISL-91 TaxID=2819151 RepID=UPI001BE58509|nr:DUF3223 domain-containing protein [Hymenobacter sp. ISL-91]MBT2558242.1 DUF3223 domain-containing protein [Hymenobacter sp. ISL-91]